MAASVFAVSGGFRHLPVMEASKLDSMLSMRDVAKAMVEGGEKPELSVGQVVLKATTGGKTLCSTIGDVTRDATVRDAIQKMRERNIGSVLVPTHAHTMAESKVGFGIFTERDALRALASGASEGTDPRASLVSAWATSDETLIWADPALPAIDALTTMAQQGMRHLPVAKPPTWLWRAGCSTSTAAPTLLAVVSMRALCANL